jgi:hypothetical protein
VFEVVACFRVIVSMSSLDHEDYELDGTVLSGLEQSCFGNRRSSYSFSFGRAACEDWVL